MPGISISYDLLCILLELILSPDLRDAFLSGKLASLVPRNSTRNERRYFKGLCAVNEFPKSAWLRLGFANVELVMF
jgi:hypothetical protein